MARPEDARQYGRATRNRAVDVRRSRGSTMGDDHVLDDLAARALDSLEAPEQARVDGHLRGCDACAARLAEYRAVVGALPLALDPLGPPPGTWATIQSGLAPRPDVR
ncbi:MAG: hypothetical protein FJZ38_16050 [Candidatus Rokubacteria bacterium]|nr:hypothetical protein [Candidatus Rokubacteria bacterium]